MRPPGRVPGVGEAYQPEAGLGATVRQRFGRALFDYGLRGLANLGQLHPSARPHRHGVEVLADLPYLDPDDGSRDHRLDVYRPCPERPSAKPGHRAYGPPYPVVLYVHGGGFRVLSKDTHWVMALALARRGMLVFNINYRLSPQHPFPAALIDCCAALAYVARHAQELGGGLALAAGALQRLGDAPLLDLAQLIGQDVRVFQCVIVEGAIHLVGIHSPLVGYRHGEFDRNHHGQMGIIPFCQLHADSQCCFITFRAGNGDHNILEHGESSD